MTLGHPVTAFDPKRTSPAMLHEPFSHSSRRHRDMITICVSSGEADISGTVKELREVALTLKALVGSGERSAVIPAQPCNPAPYEQSLLELAFTRLPGPTSVSADAHRLTVSGPDQFLAGFASWFEFPQDAAHGTHNHFEPWPGDPDHSTESLSLVVSVRHAGAV